MNNQIVYSANNGFGILLDQDVEGCKIRFLGNRQNRWLSPSELSLVDPHLISYLGKDSSYGYSPMVQTRGREYFRSGNVKAMRYDPETASLCARVKGSSNSVYDTAVTIRNGKRYSSCTCPVDGDCKHGFALLLYAANVFTLLSTDEAVEPTAPLPETLAQAALTGQLTDAELRKVLRTFGPYWDYHGKELAALVEKMYFLNYRGKVKNALLKELERLPDSRYLREYLECEDWQWRYQVLEADASMLEHASEPEQPEAFWGYFTAEYEVLADREQRKQFTIYRLLSPAGEKLMEIISSDGSSCRLNGSFRFHISRFPCFAKALMQRVETKYADALHEKRESLQKEIDRVNRERSVRALVESTKELCRSFTQKGNILADMQKATLECSLNRVPLDQKVELSLRVGVDKLYVVSRPIEFLDRFAHGVSHRYGKQFELTHILDNFDEPSRNVLSLLLEYRDVLAQSLDYQERRIRLSSKLTSRLLTALQGHRLLLGDVPYRVRLEDIPVFYSVDAEYHIHCTTGDNVTERLIYLLDDTAILLDKENRILDRAAVSADELPLLKYAWQHDNADISPVLDLFRNEICPRFASRFSVDPAIQEKLSPSQLEICAYFDYQDGKISCNSKLYLDGQEVTEKNLVSSLDAQQYQRYCDYLEQLGFRNGHISDETAVLMFFKMDFALLKQLCTVYLSDSIRNRQCVSFTKQTVRIQYDSGIMEAFLQPSDYSDAELEQILKAIRKKKKFILLRDDRIVDLDNSEAAEFAETVSELGLNAKKLHEQKELTMVTALKAFAHEQCCVVDDYLKKMMDDIRSFQTAEIPLPPLQTELRPYQIEGFRWLRILSEYHMGGILSDDMGLGKTLQIIAMLAADKAEQPSLVICPKSLIFNWVSEFQRFCPEAAVISVYGTTSVRQNVIERISNRKKIVCITSYESLRNDSELYKKCRFRYVILDEAQYIKNVDAQKTKGVKSLKAELRFALTGTPIENSVIDLWSIFDFIMPGYLEELGAFKNAYSRDESAFLNVLSRRIAPFVLRRTKEDVLQDLPGKYERVLTADMTAAQRKLYDAYVLQAKQKLEEGEGAFDILPYLTRLRQICVDPGMLVEGYDGESGKLQELETLLQDYIANGHRILLFSAFVKALHSVIALLKRNGIDFDLITGDTPAAERIQRMNRFNGPAGAPVFLISLKAGGTGLNLTGADTVIHLDPWWNAAAEEQATDRAHRIGQTRNVEVIRLICSDSIEQRVIELQNQKKDVIDRVLSNDESSVIRASLENISFLLNKG